MPRALFIGDINVDVMMGGMESLPVVDREVVCKTYDVVMGASTVICACTYASLGGDSSMAGLAGRDDYGEFMIRGLGELGVKTDLVKRTDRVRTGVTVNLIYQSTRTQVTYQGTLAEFDGSELADSILDGFNHVHFGGVYLLHKLRPEITRLLKAAKARGVTSSLDPQWDPSEKWEGMDEWLPLLTYLFVNEDEALSLARAKSPKEACKALTARTRMPLVKVGPEGSLVYVDGAVKAIPSYKVEVVDTTGAGDSFDAAFLFAMIEKQMEPVAACAFANAVAARSCMFVGGVNARTSYAEAVRFGGER
jgi:ribokinase